MMRRGEAASVAGKWLAYASVVPALLGATEWWLPMLIVGAAIFAIGIGLRIHDLHRRGIWHDRDLWD